MDEPCPTRARSFERDSLPDDVSAATDVDRSLIIEMLRLSPAERLGWHDQMVNLVDELRNAMSL